MLVTTICAYNWDLFVLGPLFAMLNTPRPDKFNWQIIFLVTNIECHTRVSQIRLEFIFEVLLPHRLSTLYLYCYNYTQAIVLPATYHSLCLKDHRLVSELIKDHYNNYSNTISTPYHEIFYGAMKYCRKGTTHHNYNYHWTVPDTYWFCCSSHVYKAEWNCDR